MTKNQNFGIIQMLLLQSFPFFFNFEMSAQLIIIYCLKKSIYCLTSAKLITGGPCVKIIMSAMKNTWKVLLIVVIHYSRSKTKNSAAEAKQCLVLINVQDTLLSTICIALRIAGARQRSKEITSNLLFGQFNTGGATPYFDFNGLSMVI